MASENQHLSGCPNDSLSVTVPVYNSASALEILCARIIQSLEKTGRPFEVILVDDRSTDGSAELAAELAQRDSRIKVLIHSGNFGQSAAVLSGLRQARGAIVITLDDDLQHRPEDFPRLIQCLEAANQRTLILGVRANRSRPWWRESVAKLANLTSNLFLEKPLPLKLTTFCCFHRSLAEPLTATGSWRSGPWISTLVSAAERTLTVAVHIDPSLVCRSRHNVGTLWRLFRYRTRLFALRRILTFTVGALFMALAMAAASAQLEGFAGASMAILAGIALFAAILGGGLVFISIAERRRSRVPESLISETLG